MSRRLRKEKEAVKTIITTQHAYRYRQRRTTSLRRTPEEDDDKKNDVTEEEEDDHNEEENVHSPCHTLATAVTPLSLSICQLVAANDDP